MNLVANFTRDFLFINVDPKTWQVDVATDADVRRLAEDSCPAWTAVPSLEFTNEYVVLNKRTTPSGRIKSAGAIQTIMFIEGRENTAGDLDAAAKWADQNSDFGQKHDLQFLGITEGEAEAGLDAMSKVWDEAFVPDQDKHIKMGAYNEYNTLDKAYEELTKGSFVPVLVGYLLLFAYSTMIFTEFPRLHGPAGLDSSFFASRTQNHGRRARDDD